MSLTLDVFGILSIIIVLIQILRSVIPWIYETWIGPALVGGRLKFKEFGEWAVITGATEGIGKAYANVLAEKGMNVVLISRSLGKLEALATEIGAKHKIQTRVIDVDFTQGPEIYEKIDKNLQGLEIGVLVNNVGMSYSNPEYFLTLPEADKTIDNLLNCNIKSVIGMTRIVLPQMVERSRGVIINISSMAAKIPNPLLSVYSGTKAFVDKFSDDLQTEYRRNNIIVQSVLPGFVATNMSKIKKPTWMSPSPDRYVRSTIRTVGISGQTTGYYPHAIMKLVIDSLVYISPSFGKVFVLKSLQSIRNKALKRKNPQTVPLAAEN